ncbi:MAG: hypothetical protein OXB88_00145 [Bacteriovoracales bacterium]|nr:hypothetical protein [Bacteriovoracales bacterium]
MAYKFFITFLLIFSSVSHAQEQDSPETSDTKGVKKETLNLVVGIKKIVKLDFEPDFTNLLKINTIGDKMDIKPVQGLNEIIFEGKKPGRTNIIVKDKLGQTRLEYQIIITETDQSKVVQELKELVGDIEGIEIAIRAGKVVVDGEIIVPKDIGRLVVALERYKDVIVFVEPSPHSMEIIGKKMQNEIRANGMDNVTVRVVNDTFWLEGVVDQAGKIKRAQDIAQALFPGKLASLAERRGGLQKGRVYIKNFIDSNAKSPDKPLPKQIKVAAQFVELSKDYARTFGFRWAPNFGGNGGSILIGKGQDGTIASSSEGSLSASISNLFPKLAAARNAGNARILQSGMIITENKVLATISKGTAIPFDTGSGEFSQGAQASATFQITATPEILKQEKVKLGGLKIKISVITGQTRDGKPLQTTNDVSTSLIVSSGDSAVVGGIFQSQSNTAYDKLPGGPDDAESDFLFNFVRSKDFKTSKNQFVVFVTPEIIDSPSKDVERIRSKFLKRSR